jgi:hypothetical protein
MKVSHKEEKNNSGHWLDKKACWEVSNCPESIRNLCPVYRNPDIPGWRVGGLYCTLFDSRPMCGGFRDVCRKCLVYLRWGDGSLN